MSGLKNHYQHFSAQFRKGMLEASFLWESLASMRLNREAKIEEERDSRPPLWTKIRSNKVVGGGLVQIREEEGPPCECTAKMVDPCGVSSLCINR